MFRSVLSFALSCFLLSSVAHAETQAIEIIIKDHHFIPAKLTIPAGQKVKLQVLNQDPTPEEFESYDFNREKIIPGNSQATIFVGPLDAGEYSFFGEFNQDTAQGQLIVQ